MDITEWQFYSAPRDVVWPAIPSGHHATTLGLLFQMERSQWLSPDQLLDHQLRQLKILLQHAYDSVPWYRDHWSGIYASAADLTFERLTTLPLLTRADLRDQFALFNSAAVPPAHGPIAESQSSGSTGTPVRILKTQFCNLLWNVFTLRDHLWHQRNLLGKLATIRHGFSAGEFESWGPATEGLVKTGLSLVRGVDSGVEAHLKWLDDHQPDYLMTYPSIAAELAKSSIASKHKLPGLREVRTFGEMLPQEVRELCAQAWQVPVTDVYSSVETGYIALQCPEGEHYHVLSEGVLVEVIDEFGKPCAPGQIGRVVITTLHNFAMPLIRYEIGDYAEVGGPCPCGRGLPVLNRILGRVRNMLVTRAGEKFWPTFGARGLMEVAPIRQIQFVQKDYDLVEARLVSPGSLTPAQETAVVKMVLSRLPAGMQLKLIYCDSIPRSAGGKFEDFISEVAVPVIKQ